MHVSSKYSSASKQGQSHSKQTTTASRKPLSLHIETASTPTTTSGADAPTSRTSGSAKGYDRTRAVSHRTSLVTGCQGAATAPAAAEDPLLTPQESGEAVDGGGSHAPSRPLDTVHVQCRTSRWGNEQGRSAAVAPYHRHADVGASPGSAADAATATTNHHDDHHFFLLLVHLYCAVVVLVARSPP